MLCAVLLGYDNVTLFNDKAQMSSAVLILPVGETIRAGIGAGPVDGDMVCRNSLQFALPLHHHLIINVVLAGLIIGIYKFASIAERFEFIVNILVNFKFFLTDGRTNEDI